jgi:hypothetical protein
MQQEKVPPGGRKREPRRKVALAARMRVAGDWRDATVLNMSSRGVMIRTVQAMRPGTYLEIRRGTDLAIVGRVVWSSGPYAGVRAQDAIDVDAAACTPGAGTRPMRHGDRRSAVRRPESPAAQAERSRQTGAFVQYVTIAAAVAFAAIIAASSVGDVLGGVADQVERALQTPEANVSRQTGTFP